MSPRATYRSRPSRARRNRRRINWLKVILNLALLALVGELVFLSLTSPRLRIRRIDVRGATTARVADLRACAQCAVGSNIILADTKKVRRNVLKNPVVLTANVRRWPLDKLIIRVQERTPKFIVTSRSKYYLADENGFIYSLTLRTDERLVTIQLPINRPLRVGGKGKPRPMGLALDCLKQAGEKEFDVTKIAVDPKYNMCLNMRSGLEVRLGQPIDIEKKLSILKGVLAAKPGIVSDAVYLDLSCTEAPAWKTK